MINEKKKFLFITDIITPYQLDFVNELKKYFDVKVFLTIGNRDKKDWKLDYEKDIWKDYSDLTKINFIKKIAQFNPDTILCGGYSIPNALNSLLWAKLNHKKIYIWLERPINTHNPLKNFMRNIYLSLLLPRYDYLLAIGKITVKAYDKYTSQIINFPYSMNLEKFYSIQRDYDKNKIKFLSSGQLIDRKNHLTLIKAFKKINNENISLTIIGGGPLKEQLLNEIGNDNRIELKGFVQPKDLPEVYKKHDIFIMPSKHDGWALVINEAMASAMPVIGTKYIGAVLEFIENGKNGYLTDIDEDSIKKAILNYIDNVDLIQEHRNYNRNLIQQSLADSKNAAKFLYELENAK